MKLWLLLLCACFDLQRDVALVRGQVLYGEAALPGALVRLIPRGSGDPTSARAVLTEANGEYRFDAVTPGEYAIGVTTDRWVYESQVSVSAIVGDAGNTYAHPSVRDNVVETVRLTPAGAVQGQVSEKKEGILVNLEGTSFQARTNARGDFEFGRVPAGLYQATAIGDGVITAAPVPFRVAAEELTSLRLRMGPIAAEPVSSNRAPAISALMQAAVASDGLFYSGTKVMRGMRMRATCLASDPDGEPLVYAWQVVGGVAEQIEPHRIEWSADGGTVSIRCTVTDSQGALDTASLNVDVSDYRFAGAALSAPYVVFAQSDSGVPDFDLIVGPTRIAAPGQQIKPKVLGTTLVYQSDHNATGTNPYDVYARELPDGAETRLSSSEGPEVFDIGPAGVAIAHNASGCTLRLDGNTVYTTAAYCDRVVVGQTTLVIRENSVADGAVWRIVTLGGGVVDAPFVDAEIVFDGSAYVASLGDGEVYRISETFASADDIGDLPSLGNDVSVSIAARGGIAAWTAFSSGGLFGSLRGVQDGTSFDLPLSGKARVLAAEPGRVLLGDERQLRLVNVP